VDNSTKKEEAQNAYTNEAYESTESKPKTSNSSNSTSSSAVRIPVKQHPLLSRNTKIVETRKQESSAHTSRQTPLPTGILTPHYTDSNSTYQVIKWASFHRETWTSLHDITGKEL